MPVRTAVLASGGGSNLQALIDHFAGRGDAAAASIVLVASNRTDAGALARAEHAGIPHQVFDSGDDGTALLALLARHRVELVVLAGYLRKLPAPVIAAFRSRIVNIHPGLLPEFGGPGMYGAKVHEAVLASGSRSSGVTIHLVDDEYDHGPVIAQWRVPVREGDTPETLAARVLEVEHLLYPRVVETVAEIIARGFFADY